MIRLSSRLLVAPLAVAASCAVTLAAPIPVQAQPGTFTLPTATPTPTPAPAGPADERAGVPIPPRVQSTATPEPIPSPSPSPGPSPGPSPSQRALATPILQPPRTPVPSAVASPRPVPQDSTIGPLPAVRTPAAAPSGSAAGVPQAGPIGAPQAQPTAVPTPKLAAGPTVAVGDRPTLPAWWPWAAGGAAALVLLGGAALLWRRRKPGVLRIAAPLAMTAAADFTDEQPRLDLTLEITAATRSVMMFTLEYRLTIANRSERAITDLNAAMQMACARASANTGLGNAPSPGAAQGLARIDRVGPHQARSITGQVQLPLSAIAPLRQGAAPLFIPLVHVTLEGSGLRVLDKSFVIGTPSASGTGRVHPILLDQPPGAIAGLVAQPIAIPPVSGPVSTPVPAGA